MSSLGIERFIRGWNILVSTTYRRNRRSLTANSNTPITDQFSFPTIPKETHANRETSPKEPSLERCAHQKPSLESFITNNLRLQPPWRDSRAPLPPPQKANKRENQSPRKQSKKKGTVHRRTKRASALVGRGRETEKSIKQYTRRRTNNVRQATTKIVSRSRGVG